MATGKIRVDIGITNPHPRGYFCARTRARNPPRAALRARTRYPRAWFARRHARTPARRRRGRRRWPTRSLGAGRRWRPAEPLSLRRSHLADLRRHRAREGVWARTTVLSEGATAFPALDSWPPSLPWIHATVLSERGREPGPATLLAPAPAAACSGRGRPTMDPHRAALVGAGPPWIRAAGDSCREARAHRPPPLLWI
jgi:hypothetical protein